MRLFGFRNKSVAARKTIQAIGEDSASSAFDLADVLEEMSFLDHLEELRWRILKGIGAVILGAVFCGIFDDFVIDQILLGPTKRTFSCISSSVSKRRR